MNDEHCESTQEKKEFFGREDKLKEIEQALECKKGAVVLHGLPGMGQTALAREYARRYNRGDVVFISYRETVAETIAGPLAHSVRDYIRKGNEKTTFEVYEDLMKLLRKGRENDLIVIDQMDGRDNYAHESIGNPKFQNFCELPTRILITTTSDVKDGITVGALPQPFLRQLVHRFLPDISDAAADQIIHAAESHTLTVELMARALCYMSPEETPESLVTWFCRESRERAVTFGEPVDEKTCEKREKFEKQDEFYSLYGLDCLDGARRTEWNPETLKIISRLQRVIQLEALSAGELNLLFEAFLVPPEGIEEEMLTMFPDFDPDAWEKLQKRGLVHVGADGRIRVHTLIRAAAWSFYAGKENRTDLEFSYVMDHDTEIVNTMQKLWLEYVPKDRDAVCSQLYAMMDHLLDQYQKKMWTSEDDHSFRDPEVDPKFYWGEGILSSIAACCAEYLEGRSFRVAALWAATTGYFRWSGRATDPLIYGESQLQLALSEIYRVVPYKEIRKTLQLAEKLMKGYPGHLAAVEYARCLLTVQKKEGYRQAKKSAKRAKELLLAASGSEPVYFASLPNLEEIEKIMEQIEKEG